MREVHQLRRKIEHTDELLGVVSTMKTMAAVNIRQYEAAVQSVRNYMRTVELGFQVALHQQPDLVRRSADAQPGPVGAVVFGSDQGMCGGFNERISEFARGRLADRPGVTDACSLMLAGHRVGFYFDADEWDIYQRLELPSAIEGVSGFVRTLMDDIDRWRRERGLARIWLFFNQSEEGARYEPSLRELLPIDRQFLRDIGQRDWTSRCEPLVTSSLDDYVRSLVDEYLYAGFFSACAESLASENAARLASMQRAEKNISDRLESLRQSYRRTRQSSITAELLDIVGGFSALETDNSRGES